MPALLDLLPWLGPTPSIIFPTSCLLQLRILEAAPRAPSGRSLRQVAAGWLQQEADSLQPQGIEFTCVSEKQPTPQQLEDLKFAW